MKARRCAFLVLVGGFVLFSRVNADQARIGAYVVDEITRKPLKGVLVRGGFGNDNGWLAWTKSAPINEDFKRTDQNGVCWLQGKTNTGEVGCSVREAPGGYYRPYCGEGRKLSEKTLGGMWQPDNLVITVALQRVERPTPLWVKDVTLGDGSKVIDGFDGTNVVLRYDLLKGDWLPPVGKGEVGDMEIASHLELGDTIGSKRYPRRFFSFVNTIEFPGEGNGVREVMVPEQSGLKLRIAPGSGYQQSVVRQFGVRKKWVQKRLWEEEFTECDKNRVLVFRIRSEFDSDGKLVGGYYGKIYGDFGFSGSWKSGLRVVRFLYYLNKASLDCNLEWDMKTNLCESPCLSGRKVP